MDLFAVIALVWEIVDYDSNFMSYNAFNDNFSNYRFKLDNKKFFNNNDGFISNQTKLIKIL